MAGGWNANKAGAVGAFYTLKDRSPSVLALPQCHTAPTSFNYGNQLNEKPQANILLRHVYSLHTMHLQRNTYTMHSHMNSDKIVN